MNIIIFGNQLLAPVGNYLEKEGYSVTYNKFSPNADVIITQSIAYMYTPYRNLKKIKKKRIKLINFILDIPPFRLERRKGPKSTIRTSNQIIFDQQRNNNSIIKYFRQLLFNQTHKNPFFYNLLNYIENQDRSSNGAIKILQETTQGLINKNYRNKYYYQINYRNFLKKADLNLAISNYTKQCLKKFLKIESEVCHLCVNSDLLLNLKPHIKYEYDAISLGKIVERKQPNIFVQAAKKLDLKILIIGKIINEWIKLDCSHFYIPLLKDAFKEITKSKLFVDCSIFEGFDMPSVEAAFLDRIIITSDTFLHKEILGNYPCYFKRNNINDLIEKIQYVRNGEFDINISELIKIKQKYSIEAMKKRLEGHIEALF